MEEVGRTGLSGMTPNLSVGGFIKMGRCFLKCCLASDFACPGEHSRVQRSYTPRAVDTKTVQAWRLGTFDRRACVSRSCPAHARLLSKGGPWQGDLRVCRFWSSAG